MSRTGSRMLAAAGASGDFTLPNNTVRLTSTFDFGSRTMSIGGANCFAVDAAFVDSGNQLWTLWRATTNGTELQMNSYTCSTPYDITTASYNDGWEAYLTSSLSSQTEYSATAFVTDGTNILIRMMQIDTTNEKGFYYKGTCSVANDLSTFGSSSIGSIENQASYGGLDIDPTTNNVATANTRLYRGNFDGFNSQFDRLGFDTVSAAYGNTVSSTSATGTNNFPFWSAQKNVSGFSFNPTGTFALITFHDGTLVISDFDNTDGTYDPPSSWPDSIATVGGHTSILGELGTGTFDFTPTSPGTSADQYSEYPLQIYKNARFIPDGNNNKFTTLFGENNKVYTYTMPSANTLSETGCTVTSSTLGGSGNFSSMQGSGSSLLDGNAVTGSSSGGNSAVAYLTQSGAQDWFGRILSFNGSTKWDIQNKESTGYTKTDTNWPSGDSGGRSWGVAWKPDGTSWVRYSHDDTNNSGDAIFEHNETTTDFRWAGAITDVVIASSNSQQGFTELKWVDQGRKLFAASMPSDISYQLASAATAILYMYDVSTPYDIRTVTKNGSSEATYTHKQTITYAGYPEAADMTDSGGKLFMYSSLNHCITEWKLTTPFDVTTATYTKTFPLANSSVLRPTGYNDFQSGRFYTFKIIESQNAVLFIARNTSNTATIFRFDF